MNVVNLYIETSWKGPAKRDGVGMWLLEFITGDVPVTRQGFIHITAGTEIQGTLQAMINGIFKLKKACSIVIYADCPNVFNAISNGWPIIWAKNGWAKNNGQEVKNKDLWEFYLNKAEPHVISIRKEDHSYKKVMAAAVAKELERWMSEKDKQ